MILESSCALTEARALRMGRALSTAPTPSEEVSTEPHTSVPTSALTAPSLAVSPSLSPSPSPSLNSGPTRLLWHGRLASLGALLLALPLLELVIALVLAPAMLVLAPITLPMAPALTLPIAVVPAPTPGQAQSPELSVGPELSFGLVPNPGGLSPSNVLVRI